MILNKLSLEPLNLFEPVEFRIGINFIYGVKDIPYASLNEIGKSLFLDFLGFALLAHFHPSNNTRLSKAYNKGILKGQRVVLDFTIGKTKYTLSRFFDDPYIVYFGLYGTARNKCKLKDLQNEFFEKIFRRVDYPGYSDLSWYRDLIKFFLKIQRVADERFTNPIRYMNSKEITLNQYHLFFLNINNSFAAENINLLNQLDGYKKTIVTSKQLLKENYELKDIISVQREISKLENETKRITNAINSFKLKEEYENQQNEVDRLTADIKSLAFLNSSDKAKITEYTNSQKDKNFITSHVKAIYDEINPVFGDLIVNQLEEALTFRHKLVDSREDFIDKEINNLKWRISQRDKVIEKKENEKTSLMNDLSKKDAIKDLTSNYIRLNQISNRKSELSSRLSLYKQSQEKIRHIKNSIADLDKEVKHLIKDNADQVTDFNNLIKEIYSNIFIPVSSGDLFSINVQEKDQKIKLNVLPDDIYSHGKNQGRTLVYDLAILFNMIDKNIKGPRFIAHDSIFDSLDKDHLKSLYNYLSEKEDQNIEFQYIATLNHQLDFHDEILAKKTHVINASEKLLKKEF